MSETVDDLELIILANLVRNNDFARMAYPVLRTDMFTSSERQLSYELLKRHFEKHNTLPKASSVAIDLANAKDLNEELVSKTAGELQQTYKIDHSCVDHSWLVVESEKWAQERAIYNAIYKSIDILDGKKKKQSKGDIPKLMQEALAITFQTTVGHDFFEDAMARYESYHDQSMKMPTSIQMINKITCGGFPRKTLDIVISPTGTGKSIYLCHEAAHQLMQGHNVLYISLELSDFNVAKRIEANLFDMNISMIDNIDKDTYVGRIESLKNSTNGRLIVKEYPTKSASSIHFRHLLEELKSKQNFVPDFLMVDYINITAAQSQYEGSNSYTSIKAIAEELRSIAQQYNLVCLSATQTNRDGMNASDFDVTEIAESTGLLHTVDFAFALIVTEDLEKALQARLKQLKNRFGPLNDPRSFLVGLDRSKMKFFDLSNVGAIRDPVVPVQAATTSVKAKLDGKKKFEGFQI